MHTPHQWASFTQLVYRFIRYFVSHLPTHGRKFIPT
jgi:hypothetical protein